MEKSKENNNNEWLKVHSKSRPGHIYLFNKYSGETKWLMPSRGAKGDASNKTDANKATLSPLKKLGQTMRTPAQDRLKRLQHELKVDHVRKELKRPGRPCSHTPERKSKRAKTKTQQENVLNTAGPTTSKAAIKHKSPVKPQKKKNSRRKSPSRRRRCRSISVSSAENDGDVLMNLNDTQLESTTTPEKPPQEDTAATTSSPTSTGLFQRIKGLFKNPFSSFKTPQDTDNEEEEIPSTSAPENTSTSSVLETALSELKSEQEINEKPYTRNKSLRKTRKSKCLPLHSERLLESQSNDLKNSEENLHRELVPKVNTRLCRTPKIMNIPSYERGSANTRLNRLKQSLIEEQRNLQTMQSSTLTASILIKSHKTDTEAATATSFIVSFSTPNQLVRSKSKESGMVEAMDWQPTEFDDNDSTDDLSSTKSEVSIQPGVSQKKSTSAETMAEIYDTVSENLLRLAAEKKRDLIRDTRKWLKDFYYFVLDTNVLLESLSFLEDLSRMKLCDTQGSVLFIPYRVLQELDKLKMCSGSKEGVKTMAVRAIKYLNKKFEGNNLNLQAQTAVEEREHLIDVNSADDSILNCCLQAKQHIQNLVLLTEDVNLRNKAICNDILVTTKSSLIYKQHNATAAVITK